MGTKVSQICASIHKLEHMCAWQCIISHGHMCLCLWMFAQTSAHTLVPIATNRQIDMQTSRQRERDTHTHTHTQTGRQHRRMGYRQLCTCIPSSLGTGDSQVLQEGTGGLLTGGPPGLLLLPYLLQLCPSGSAHQLPIAVQLYSLYPRSFPRCIWNETCTPFLTAFCSHIRCMTSQTPQYCRKWLL